MKFKITPSDALGAQLRSEIVNLLNGVNADLNEGLKNIAQQGEAKAKDLAASRLHSTRQQYEDALNAVQLGPNKWAIVLNADAAYLEEGYASFDMKAGMLNSNSVVSTGKRAGQKWVRTSKDGYRYAVVPMDQSGTGKGAGRQSPDSQVQIQNPVTQGQNGLTRQGGQAQGLQSRGDLKADMDQMIKRAGLRGISKDSNGAPIIGKVASVRNGANPGDMQIKMADGTSRTANLGTSLGGGQNEVNPLLSGLTKYQYEHKNAKTGKSTIKSSYMTYRVVSEKPGAKGQWKHPGFMGAKIFPDLEKWAESALTKMVEDMFRSAG